MNKNVKNLAYFGLGVAYTVCEKVHNLSTKAIDKSQKIKNISQKLVIKGEGAAKDNLKKINEIKSVGIEKSSILKEKFFNNGVPTKQLLNKIDAVDKTLKEHIQQEKESSITQ